MQQLSAEYVYAVTGGQEVPEDQEPGPLFTEFMDMRTAELREQGVSKELAEHLAEDEWFTAPDGYDSEAERESYYRSIGYTDTEAHAAAVDDLVGEPA